MLAYEDTPTDPLTVNAYAYPFIDKGLLQRTLPFLSYLTPFTYGITEEGGLVVPGDEPLIRAAHAGGTAALMHLSTLTQEGASPTSWRTWCSPTGTSRTPWWAMCWIPSTGRATRV